jgi:hypothetical protein
MGDELCDHLLRVGSSLLELKTLIEVIAYWRFSFFSFRRCCSSYGYDPKLEMSKCGISWR